MAALERFLRDTKLTPQALVEMASGPRNDVVTDYISGLMDAKKSGSYAKGHKRAITSWLSWNDQVLTRRIKISGLNTRTRLRRAHMPSQEELRQVLNAADARARAAVVLLAHAGLRPEVLGNYDGSDGLRIADFPEATLKEGVLTFDVVPTRVTVREELSKTKKPYFTFIGAEACQYVAAYVRERHEAGEKITPETPLFKPRKQIRGAMATNSISAIVRKPMRASGMHNNPPYIWRSYHSNRTLLAEADGLLHDFRVYMTGHLGSLEIDYGLRKTLQKDVVERMRTGYKAALRYLETTSLADSEKPGVAVTSSLLQIAGYTPEQVAGLRVEEKGEQERVELMRAAWQDFVKDKSKSKQKTVDLKDLDAALSSGWIYRTTLPDGRVLVETT